MNNHVLDHITGTEISHSVPRHLRQYDAAEETGRPHQPTGISIFCSNGALWATTESLLPGTPSSVVKHLVTDPQADFSKRDRREGRVSVRW